MKKRYEVKVYDVFGREVKTIDELIEDMKSARFFVDLLFRTTFETLEEWENATVKIIEVEEDEDGEIIDTKVVETLEYPFEKTIVKAGTYDCYEKDVYTVKEDMQGVIVDYQGGLTVKLADGYHVYNLEIEDVRSI